MRVTIEPALAALGHTARAITVVLDAPAANLAAMEVRVVQQGTAHPGAQRGPDRRRDPHPAEAGHPRRGRAEAAGGARPSCEIEARDTLWRPGRRAGRASSIASTVDLTPPKLELKTATGYIKHAGAGVVVYRPEGAVRSGVRIGNEFFPGVAGLAQDPAGPGGAVRDPLQHACGGAVRRGGRRGRATSA